MQKFTLLYVDDEKSNLRIFRDTFRRDFNVFTALSAKEGIEILDNNQIDLVLSDQRMPEMTGVEFLKYSLEQHPGLHRILITGYSDMDAVGNAINHAHIFQYVQKPWNKNNLLAIINNALGLYKLEQENIKQREELIKAKERAEQSDRLKTEFLQNMSHEIRTPMNGIVGFADLLDVEGLLPDERKGYVSLIKQSSQQLLNIINDIVDVSKIESGQVTVNKTRFSIEQMFDDLYLFFKRQIEGKNIDLVFDKSVSGELSDEIETDDIKLRQVLTNLLSNAIKFTEKGFVKFGYAIDQYNLICFVEDTGEGIGEKDLDNIFDRFWQSRQNRPGKGGTGLGLAISKAYVELLGGVIEVESELNKGTTFSVTIPLG
jgi:signal transduction histidine kinase